MHLVSAPPADDRRREMLGDASHRLSHLRRNIRRGVIRRHGTAKKVARQYLRRNAHLLRHDGGVGVLDDRRQGAVVVQEHHDLLPVRRGQNGLELHQCRRVLLLRKYVHRGIRPGQEHNRGRGCKMVRVRARVHTIQSSWCSARRGEVAITESSQDAAAAAFLHPMSPRVGGGNDVKRRTGDGAASSACFVICDRAGGREQNKRGRQTKRLARARQHSTRGVVDGFGRCRGGLFIDNPPGVSGPGSALGKIRFCQRTPLACYKSVSVDTSGGTRHAVAWLDTTA
jgi:hypothetical protein